MSPDPASSQTADVVAHSSERLRFYLAQIARCTTMLSTHELWFRPNEHVNSVANLVLHLTGNVSQWILAGLTGENVARDRPAEFAARDGRSAAQLLPPLRDTVHRAIAAIEHLDAAQMQKPLTIQGYQVTAQIAVLHVVEHFAFHAGQIVHATKWIKDVDLSQYDQHGQRLDRSGHP